MIGKKRLQIFILGLLCIFSIFGLGIQSAAGQPGFWVFINADCTQTEGVGGGFWEPNSAVTLEIDNGNNNSVDYTATIIAGSDGNVWFPANGLFSVSEGDLVRVYDNQTVKTHIVDFLVITDVDLVNDIFIGLARQGTNVFVRIFGGPSRNVVADEFESWSVSFYGEFDIGRCTGGLVQTTDEDGDHTQINLPISPCPGFTIFMNSDFTQTEGVGGFFWEPNSTVTLEIDNGNNNSVDYAATIIAGSDGNVWFPANGLFSVSEGDLVTMYDDDQYEQVIKTHIVNYLTLTYLNTSTDTLIGRAREGKEVEAKVFDPEFPVGPQLQVIADSSETWIADFSSEIDIVIGSAGFVYIQDNDADKTQINWQAQEIITQVTIDIKPGSDPNSINPKSIGVIGVAILTTDTFDATTANPLSVRFGPNGATEYHSRGHIEDVDTDGDLDLVLHFKTQDTGIQCGDTSASLIGSTFEGVTIEGYDSIVTTGCI